MNLYTPSEEEIQKAVASYDTPLTEKDVYACITYNLEDETIAIRLLRHIKRLEARIEVLEKDFTLGFKRGGM